jgi:LacI family transcriptional regulator
MQDIATAAGVGKATVSLALRDDPRLKEATRRRIQKIAQEMGYRANAVVANLMAQLRASKAPKFQATLGLINAAPEKHLLEGVHTFHEWVTGCLNRARQLGYGFDEFWLHEPGVTPARLVKILESRNIRGLVIAAVLDHGRLPEEFSEIWNRFASVVVGIQTTHPPLHFACNDQYSTALHAVHETLLLGYRNPALVISPKMDELLDYRFSSGFLAAKHELPQRRILAPFHYAEAAQQSFAAWFRKNRPDVILTVHDQIKEWLQQMKVKVPQEVGLVHLDRTSNLENWAGMKQNNDLVGMSAVDILIGQLHRNESGTPPFTKCVLVESTWMNGPTVRQQKPKS